MTDWTTLAEVAGKLRKIGLDVQRQQLSDAVRDHLLPDPELVGMGPGKGVERRWPAWVYGRAKYLFRLRRRGAKGEILRLLLYMQDGWGWEFVRSICLEGLKKCRLAQSSPVIRHVRKPTPQSVNFEIDDIAESTEIKHLDLAKFIFGVGQFGRALPGTSSDALAPIMPLAGVTDEDAPAASSLAMLFLGDSGLDHQTIRIMVAECTSDQADVGRTECVNELRRLRRLSHGKRDQPFRESRQSTNLLTFGQPAGALATDLRHSPTRITPAQLLGGYLGGLIALECSGLLELASLYELLESPID